MTTDEAREAAWREHVRQIPLLSRMESKSLHVRVTKLGYEAGWGARGEYDKEQIAALVAYVQHRDDCYAAGHRALIAGRATECVCGLNDALRALAGQSEEDTG